MFYPKLLVVTAAALVLGGCGDDVLDYRNAELSVGKFYEKGANEPFTGKITNVKLSGLPKHDHISQMIRADMSGLGKKADTTYCNIVVNKGVLDGKVSCTFEGQEDIVFAADFKKGLLDGKVEIPKNPAEKRAFSFEYVNNDLNGDSIIYYESGQIASRTQYKDGLPHGVIEYFGMNGQIAERSEVVNGKMNGTTTAWHENGNKSMEAAVKDNKRDGAYKEWDKNGKLKTHDIYKDGKYVESKLD